MGIYSTSRFMVVVLAWHGTHCATFIKTAIFKMLKYRNVYDLHLKRLEFGILLKKTI
jgi:hypothetical protein